MKSRIPPKINLSERYSIKGMAKSRGISINEFKKQIIREEKIKYDLIQKYISKGYSVEQAELTTMRILCIPGFGGHIFLN